MPYKPKPGDFGLSMIGGLGGWWVNIGQALTGDSSRYTHAFVVLDNDQIIEAVPGGARIISLSEYEGSPDVVFSRFNLTDLQRQEIVMHARSFEGTPYSFLDYLCLAMVHFKFRPKWLRNYIKGTGHMICSQLVDEAFLRANVHLFDDGRDPGDVTPGDLLYVVVNYY